MRNLPVKFIPGVMVLLVVGGATLGRAQNVVAPSTSPPAANASPSKELPPDKVKPSELEQMLAEALVSNPDIRVAEAKLREAEAELNRVRFQVLQKVSMLYHAVEGQKATLDALEQAPRRTLEDRNRTVILIAQEKSKLASLEAELPAVLGRPPQSGSREKKGTETGANLSRESFRTHSSLVSHALLSWTGCTSCHDAAGWKGEKHPEMMCPALILRPLEGARVPSSEPAQGALADKIRKALDRAVPVIDIKNKSLREALQFFEEEADGISFHTVFTDPGHAEEKVNLHLRQVPLGAALQALEDTFPSGRLRCAVRDYGILVTTADLPAGATRLHDFWTGPAGKAKAKENIAPENADEKTPPPDNLQGVIKATDPQRGLVTINIGSDAGLHNGHTLEVFRLKPQPMYLGTVRIVEVKPSEAVAQPMTPHARTAIRVSDQVATSIRRR